MIPLARSRGAVGPGIAQHPGQFKRRIAGPDRAFRKARQEISLHQVDAVSSIYRNSGPVCASAVALQ